MGINFNRNDYGQLSTKPAYQATINWLNIKGINKCHGTTMTFDTLSRDPSHGNHALNQISNVITLDVSRAVPVEKEGKVPTLFIGPEDKAKIYGYHQLELAKIDYDEDGKPERRIYDVIVPGKGIVGRVVQSTPEYEADMLAPLKGGGDPLKTMSVTQLRAYEATYHFGLYDKWSDKKLIEFDQFGRDIDARLQELRKQAKEKGIDLTAEYQKMADKRGIDLNALYKLLGITNP